MLSKMTDDQTLTQKPTQEDRKHWNTCTNINCYRCTRITAKVLNYYAEKSILREGGDQ